MTDLNETLAGMQALAEGQATGYKRMLELNGGIGKLGVRHPDLFDAMIQWDAYSTNGHADTVLALLSAVKAVLALHACQIERSGASGWAPHEVCSEDEKDWPCPTVKALTDALEGQR